MGRSCVPVVCKGNQEMLLLLLLKLERVGRSRRGRRVAREEASEEF